jgi:hypothetical protein
MTTKNIFYFVYKDKEIGTNEIIKVDKMDYNDFIHPHFYNKKHSQIHGSEGIFANTLSEAMDVDLNFDNLMNDDLDSHDFRAL